MASRIARKKPREEYAVGEKMYSELSGDRLGAPPKGFAGRKREIWEMYRQQCPWLCVADTHAMVTFCSIAVKLEQDYYQLAAHEKNIIYDLMSTLGFHPLARAHLATKRKNVDVANNLRKGVNATRQAKQRVDEPSKQNVNGHAKKDIASTYFD